MGYEPSARRQASETVGERLNELGQQRLDDREYLIVSVDGIQFGGYYLLGGLVVDERE